MEGHGWRAGPSSRLRFRKHWRGIITAYWVVRSSLCCPRMLGKVETALWIGGRLRLARECTEGSGCQGPVLQQGSTRTGALRVYIRNIIARWSPSMMSWGSVCSG